MDAWFEGREVVARKQHVCSLCHRRVDSGERYHRQAGVWDGSAYTWKMCTHCEAMREQFGDDWWDDGGEGWGYDSVLNWEPSTVAGLRCKVQWGRRWRRRDGALYPVPS